MSGAGGDAAAVIRAEADLPYAIGIVLGSGLSGLADDVAEALRIPYSALPGFPLSNVSSHHNELVAGWLEGVAVAVFSGREHYFENGNAASLRETVRSLLHSDAQRRAQAEHNFASIQHIRPEETCFRYAEAFNRALAKGRNAKRIPLPRMELSQP